MHIKQRRIMCHERIPMLQVYAAQPQPIAEPVHPGFKQGADCAGLHCFPCCPQASCQARQATGAAARIPRREWTPQGGPPPGTRRTPTRARGGALPDWILILERFQSLLPVPPPMGVHPALLSSTWFRVGLEPRQHMRSGGLPSGSGTEQIHVHCTFPPALSEVSSAEGTIF